MNGSRVRTEKTCPKSNLWQFMIRLARSAWIGWRDQTKKQKSSDDVCGGKRSDERGRRNTKPALNWRLVSVNESAEMKRVMTKSASNNHIRRNGWEAEVGGYEWNWWTIELKSLKFANESFGRVKEVQGALASGAKGKRSRVVADREGKVQRTIESITALMKEEWSAECAHKVWIRMIYGRRRMKKRCFYVW